MMDAGKVTICELTNTAEKGNMPVYKLIPGSSFFYENRFVGYGRQYDAKGVNERVDLLIRTWRYPKARIGMYAVLSSSDNDGQYRIDNVQHGYDDDGLQITDLTLYRLDELYEISTS